MIDANKDGRVSSSEWGMAVFKNQKVRRSAESLHSLCGAARWTTPA